MVFLILATVYLGGTLLSYVVIDEPYGVTELLVIIAIVVAWGQFFTWGTREELQKDEMGKQIVRNSGYISYNVVFWALLILWVVDIFFINHGQNYTLFIAVCIASLTNPLLQFIHVKKKVG
ncbi:hypothetical protein ACIQXF_12440 [Lysinibacillus sp. NPDC097231]|uniref:hypothetical protein n=1 Tax=Lysinibacillus sp. NPDC097231 TaxID=3364142 RepID=UPI0037F9B679